MIYNILSRAYSLSIAIDADLGRRLGNNNPHYINDNSGQFLQKSHTKLRFYEKCEICK